MRGVKSRLKSALNRYSQATEAGDLTQACASLIEVTDYLMWAGLPRLVIDLMRAVSRNAERLRAAAPRHWAELLATLGRAQSECGDQSQALATFNEALELAQKSKDRQLKSTVLQSLGVASFRAGAPADALRYYRRSLRLKRRIGDEYGIGQVLNNLASMAIDEGNLEQADQLLAESLDIKRRLDDRHGMIAAYGSLGNLAVAAGRHGDARKHFARALRYALLYGDAEEICLAHLNLGNVLVELGDTAGALSQYSDGIGLAMKAGQLSAEAMLRKGISVACAKAGQLGEAKDHFLACAKVAKKLGNGFDEAMAYHDAGVMAAQASDGEAGLRYLRIAAARFKSIRNTEWHARTLWEMGSVLGSLGRLNECRQAVATAIRALSRKGDVAMLGEAYIAGVSILLSAGRADWAVDLFRKERRFLRTHRGRRELARRMWAVGNLLIEHKSPGRAIGLLSRAGRIYGDLRDHRLRSLVRNDLAQARAEAGQLAAARSDYEDLVQHGRRTRNRVLQLLAVTNLAEVTRRLGQTENAVRMGEEGASLARQLHDLSAMATLLNNLGLAYQDAEDLRMARLCFRESLKHAKQQSDVDAMASALNSLGTLEHTRGGYEKALGSYSEAVGLLGPDPHGLTAKILINRLACLIALGRGKEASDTATRAIAMAERLHDYESIENIAWQMATANLEEGALSSAAKALVMGFGYALLRGRRYGASNLARWLPLVTETTEVPYDRHGLSRALIRAVREMMPGAAPAVRRVLEEAMGRNRRPR